MPLTVDDCGRLLRLLSPLLSGAAGTDASCKAQADAAVPAAADGLDPSCGALGRRLPVPVRGCPVTACTVQGMARVRSGQARPRPVVSGRSVRRGSGVKRDFACTLTRDLPPVLVALRSQSRLRLEGWTRTLSGPSPDLSPAWALALSTLSDQGRGRSSLGPRSGRESWPERRLTNT